MQAKQEPSDPASSPEVMKTLVVEALIWNKGRWEGIQVPGVGGAGGVGRGLEERRLFCLTIMILNVKMATLLQRQCR